MARTEITPALVEQVEKLLAEGVSATKIAIHLGITPYVVDVIANDDEPRDKPARPQRSVRHRVINSQRGIDATTIRMIQRMLAVGILTCAEIAREAGVSPNTVTAVATGKRQAVTIGRPQLDVDERFLPKPIRCGHCGARISVTPCRACRAEWERLRRSPDPLGSSTAHQGA